MSKQVAIPGCKDVAVVDADVGTGAATDGAETGVLSARIVDRGGFGLSGSGVAAGVR